MKDKNTLKQHTYIYISILAIIVILASKTLARFTANKKHDGNIIIKNHPGGRKLRNAIIEDNGGINAIKVKGTPDFSKTATTKEGMFMAEDDYGESYYYRGVADNWVDFAGFYWRIIRINGDGSIRLIYSGTKTNNTGDGTQIGTSAYNPTYNDEEYADYKISTIKEVVDNWYKTNILDKGFDGKIADTGYCNDMTKYNSTYFSSYNRLYTNKVPTLKCPDKESDLLSRSNNKLTYPVGLLTHDEASFAGGAYYNTNKNYYLTTGKWYWTMAPAHWDGFYVYVGHVTSTGSIDGDNVDDSNAGVRPVLSLKPNVLVSSGDGTLNNPYVIN